MSLFDFKNTHVSREFLQPISSSIVQTILTTRAYEAGADNDSLQRV